MTSAIIPELIQDLAFDKAGARGLLQRSGAVGLGVPENASFLGKAVAGHVKNMGGAGGCKDRDAGFVKSQILNQFGYTQQVQSEVQSIDSLLVIKLQIDSQNTVKFLMCLLIEYIIANMRGDGDGTQQVAQEIQTLIGSFEQEVHDASDLKDHVQALANIPNPSTETLNFLKEIETRLRHSL